MKKTLLCLMLCVALVLTTVTVFAAEKPAETKLSSAGGVYQIGTKDDLKAFRDLVNSGSTNVNAVLTANINLGGEEWMPIGLGEKPYAGHFDGQGYTISGLSLTKSYGDGQEFTNTTPSLFGHIKGAGIRNLTVSGTITSYGTATNMSDMGYGYATGMVVGFMTDSIIYNCYGSGTIACENLYIGGLVGVANHSIMINCGSSVTITTNSTGSVGGLVGFMSAGYDKPMCLLNSYSTSNITNSASGNTGGLVGLLEDDAVNNYFSGTVSNSDGKAGKLILTQAPKSA